jgi:putative ribosome biogenesis GTPase RsgA
VITWQGYTCDEIEGRVRECETTTKKIMSHLANGGLMFDAPGIDDVLVYDLSTNGMQ